MRIGYIGCFNHWHTEWGVAKALEKRAEVDRYYFNRVDEGKFTSRDYDIVLTTVPHLLSRYFWEKQKGVKVAHYFDLIYNWHGRDKIYFPALKNFDLVLSTDGFDSKPYERAGIKRIYFRQAYNPDWYYPTKRSERWDVSFIGQKYGDRRILINELNSRYRFHHIGWDGSCRGEAHSNVCAASKIMVCENATNDVPGYWSNRVYLHLACGAFVLHPKVGGMDKYFKDGEHLVYWRNQTELFKKIDYYLARPKERKRIAKAGYELVRSRDTWDSRMEEFWQILCDSGLSHIPTERRESECSDGTSTTA